MIGWLVDDLLVTSLHGVRVIRFKMVRQLGI